MAFQDKSLTCVDCAATFTFTAAEQELFASKGYSNDPKRCLSCRQARRSERSPTSGGFTKPQRQLFPAVCAQCGKETEVPFQPREGRPVYCSDCYSKNRPAR